MLPVIQIGPLALQTSPLLLLASFMLALELTQRAATRLGLNGGDAYNLGYLAALAAVLGARAGFVLLNWPAFRSDLSSVIALSADGMSPALGLAAALVTGFAVAQRKGMASRRFLDALAPGLVVITAGVALADLASGDSYGSATTLPWAIQQWDALRHPVQIYHLLAVAAIGLLVLRTSRPFDGAHFGLFVALYAAQALFLEAFQGDSAFVGDVRVVQVVSLIVLMAALALLRRWATRVT